MMIRFLTVIGAMMIAVPPALADDFEELRSTDDVAVVMDRLEAAVLEAGATVFARIDHAAGAASAGLELVEAEVLIFGNPRLGTPAMQDDIRAGLMLPLRVLVHADGDDSVIVWEEPDEMFNDLDISDHAEYMRLMDEALVRLVRAAAGLSDGG